MIDHVLWTPEVVSMRAARALLEEREAEEWNEAVIGMADGSLGVEAQIRHSSIQWLPDNHWFTAVIWQALNRANDQAFHFILSGHEAVQLTRYQVGEHYRWHSDMFYPHPGEEDTPIEQRTVRKLSCTIPLNPAADYHGGDLVLQDAYGLIKRGGDNGEDWRAVGCMVAFPSTMQHQVIPVRAGMRYSAVLWATGPVWR